MIGVFIFNTLFYGLQIEFKLCETDIELKIFNII